MATVVIHRTSDQQYVGSYSLGERLLRLCTFQAGIYSGGYPGWFEEFIHHAFLLLAETDSSTKMFDAERAQRSLGALQRLGGDIEFIQPKDGQAEIQMLFFQASTFQSKLEELGAEWKLIELEGEQIIAIISPLSEGKKWQEFEQDMLSRFKWKKRLVQNRWVIVTCENAAPIQNSSPPKLFLHINSASSVFCMLGVRIGFWLGCKQDVCVYDPRGTWKSSGVPSEAGYYNDAEAVLEHILKKKPYPLEDVWATSACGGCCTGAYLKQKHHEHNINMMVESGYVNIDEDFFSQQSWLVRWFPFLFREGLKSRDIPEGPYKPHETGFRIEDLWRDLKKKTGRVIVVYPENDQFLPTPKTPNKMVALASKISTEVFRISFISKSGNPHRDRFYNYPNSRDEVLNKIFMP